jgi:hypothetical protein
MSKEDIKQLLRRNFISSKKGKLYSNQSPEGKVKAEVRVLAYGKDDVAPALLCNLVRLSRGEVRA